MLSLKYLIFTYLNKLTYLIFRKEDECILKHCVDEGQVIEPESYYPIIPMVLINGASGIGTGYSTDIPCFKVEEVIDNLKTLITGKGEMKELTPYYNSTSDYEYPNLISKVSDNNWISYASFKIINNSFLSFVGI